MWSVFKTSVVSADKFKPLSGSHYRPTGSGSHSCHIDSQTVWVCAHMQDLERKFLQFLFGFCSVCGKISSGFSCLMLVFNGIYPQQFFNKNLQVHHLVPTLSLKPEDEQFLFCVSHLKLLGYLNLSLGSGLVVSYIFYEKKCKHRLNMELHKNK